MKKRIFFTLIGLLVIVGILAGVKAWQFQAMAEQGQKFVMPPAVVTATQVRQESWESTLTAVGSVEAVQGVTVAAELPGKVEQVAFDAGDRVKVGSLLIQQDVSVEKAQLRALEAQVDESRLAFKRAKQLLPNKAIAQSDYDNARFRLAEVEAQADNIRALIAKKSISAPFSGRLGIRQVNQGQVINTGEAIVTLQSLDPVFVNFLLPQRRLGLIRPGLQVRVTSDALPNTMFKGVINAIDPEVDARTRNIRVQAKLGNPEEHLRTGMFVNLALVLPQTEELMVIPATAVLYAPYSDSVFVIEEKKDASGKVQGQVLRQQFVNLGQKRGDFVAVKSGLSLGDQVVSTGAFKLRNGQSVTIDNTLAPEFKLNPHPAEG